MKNIKTRDHYTTLSLEELLVLVLIFGLKYDLLLIYHETIRKRFDSVKKKNKSEENIKEFFFTHDILVIITPKIILLKEALDLLETVIAERELV